jgi:hypothetical protein
MTRDGTVGRSDATEPNLAFHRDIDPVRMMRTRFADPIRASSPPGLHQQAGHMTASDLCAARQMILPGGGHPHMKRRDFITLFGGAAAAWPLAARGQSLPSSCKEFPPTAIILITVFDFACVTIRHWPRRRPPALARQRRYRIGHLAIAAPSDTPPPPPANWNAFVQGLREAGYIEGQNIEFEHRSAHDQPELFPKLASELAELKVDVIFARGTWALAAAKNATRTIPIAGIDLEIDPVEAGLVASIARPGGNITGMFLDLSELSGKHLQLLKEIIPRTSRVAVLGDPDINAPQLRELTAPDDHPRCRPRCGVDLSRHRRRARSLPKIQGSRSRVWADVRQVSIGRGRSERQNITLRR